MNTRRSILVVLALTAFVATPGYAQQPAQPNVHDVLQRIESARQHLQSLDARFDQERVMGLFAQTLHAAGRLVVQRPDRVRWEVTAPTPGVFIVSGSRVAYRAGGSSAAANQNQVGPLGAVLGDLAQFLGGALEPLAQRYRFSVANGPNGTTILTAEPLVHEISSVVSRVRLQFGTDLRVIESIVMDEPNGDSTRILVHDVHVNAAIPPSTFTI